jgi:hypothetical protein
VLKIRQALGLNLIATDTRLIKATNLALNITKTNEIVNKYLKTGKMTVMVKAMKVFVVNIAVLGTLVLEKC